MPQTYGMDHDASYDPASVDMPPMPSIQTGEDGLSMTIASVLPTLSAPLAANVAALQAKETMFSGKIDSAKSAYSNSDDQGGQGIGQLGQMMGQVGQMAQQAGQGGGGSGGGSGIFGSLMEQAMKMAQGGGGKDGGAGGEGAGGAPPGDQAQAGQPAQAPQHDEAKQHAAPERPPVAAAGPSEGQHAAGPAPVGPPEHSRRDDEDLSRRM
jgi:hypothetical protein